MQEADVAGIEDVELPVAVLGDAHRLRQNQNQECRNEDGDDIRRKSKREIFD